jgi:uncharacterized protein
VSCEVCHGALEKLGLRCETMSETGTASTELERLNTVQTLDSELDALKLEEASIPADLKAAREEKLRLETDLARTREDHGVVRREYSSADLELKDLSAKREKSRQDQKQAMSAKEQSQYESVIMQLSGRIEELENDALPLVERMEALDTRIKGLDTELSELLPKLASLENLDQTRIGAIHELFDAKMIKRNALSEDIDFKLLREYDSVRKSKRGIGLVPIKMGGKCGGCNVVLPVNIQQRIKAGASGMKCPSCGRLLWSAPSD